MTRRLSLCLLLPILVGVAACGEADDGSTGNQEGEYNTSGRGGPEATYAVKLIAAQKNVGNGCHGGCGVLAIDLAVKNIAYEKKLTVSYSVDGGATQSSPARYDGPHTAPFEKWRAEIGLPRPDSRVQFWITYEVSGQTHVDDNGGTKYSR